jgi:MYXO-CTERM domain-containing protein
LAAGTSVAGPVDDLQPGFWYRAPNSKLRQVAPSPEPPGATGVASVIIAWSGGTYDTTRDRLIVWGGGHSDYGGNEIYAFDVNTLQWSRLTNPSSASGGSENSGVYGDGRPRSTHSYNALTYAPSTDRFYVTGMGSVYASGQQSNHSAAFDFGSNNWVSIAQKPSFGFNDSAVTGYDAATGHIWLQPGGDSRLLRYDTANNTWSTHTTSSNVLLDLYGTAAVDPGRRLMVATGGYNGEPQLFVWDLAQPGRILNVNPTGATQIERAKAPGFAFDEVRKVFVAWNGGASVYTLDPSNWVWTQVAPAAGNSVVPAGPDERGTYGRFRYIPSKNAFVVVSSVDQDVYFYKLSAGSGTPQPTVSLNANPTSVNQGGSSQLTWNSSNADSCAASGAWSGNKGLSGNEMVGPLSATSTFTLACSASGGASASRSVTVTVASSTPAPTVTFTANPTSVAVGGSSTLNWSSSNATSCTGSGGLSGWAGSKATSGSQSVGPFSVASTFTLACTGAGGTTQRTATVSLVAAPTVNLSANPTSVTSGNTTRLTWSSTNATGCAATGAWAGNKATSGNQTTAALTQTSTFTLACTGAGGTTSRSVTVNVTPAGPPPPGAPTVSLSANPTSVTSGGTSRLTWSSSNATGCAASGAWTGNKATSGNQMTAALTQTSTFTLACTGAGGTTSRSVTVNVTPPGAPPPGAPTVSLSASPMTVAVNGSTTLTWSSSNATTCTASDGWTGSKPMSGNETRTDLNDTTTFSLQCTGAGGSDGASVTVTVTPGGGGGGDDTTVDESGGGAIDWLLATALFGLLLTTRRRRV